MILVHKTSLDYISIHIGIEASGWASLTKAQNKIQKLNLNSQTLSLMSIEHWMKKSHLTDRLGGTNMLRKDITITSFKSIYINFHLFISFIHQPHHSSLVSNKLNNI